MHVFSTGQLTNPRYVINFPTKRHWRGKSRLGDIESGLLDLVSVIKRLGMRSIAIPPLGCGLGGLSWGDVRIRIEAALAILPDVRVLLYEPAGAPPAEVMVRSTAVPEMTAGRAALVGLVQRYLAGLMDPTVTLLEIHKLMYFMQEAGEPLKLNFTQAPNGPYAENLRHVLSRIEGHFISGYADGGDRPDKQLQLVPGALEEATKALSANSETRTRFDRVDDLVQGFESAFGLELLATVHWVVTRQGATTDDEVVKRTYAWNECKQRFSPEQIIRTRDVLAEKDWLAARPA